MFILLWGCISVEKEIGRVTHYFSSIGVAAIKLNDSLKVGDKIRIKGATTDFEQTIESMQIDKTSITGAKPGDEIGIKVKEKVRGNDAVYKIE